MVESTALCEEDTSTIRNEETEELELLGDTVKPLGEPLEITGNFTYTNCSNGCEVNEVSEHSLVKVLRLGHELGDVEGEGQVLAECSSFHCVYKGSGLRHLLPERI